jgi:serine/threonine protein kinase
MAAAPHTAALPDRFGKYEILRHLATGGMADVFVARASGIEGFSKILVLKRIRPELAGDPGIVDLFLHEARLAATLEHPNIAQVYDVGMVNDSYFFTMEYVHGADLRAVLRESIVKKRPIPLADAVLIGRDVCAALHYAHEKRGFDGRPLDLIHRDVSPSNVLLSYDGAVKVCDFGIAKATSLHEDTNQAVLKGKFSYMSPEQLRCQPLDRRSDIFAIAIVLYELTTQTKLFRGDSDFDVMKAVAEQHIIEPSVMRPDYPRELERIVLKGLNRGRDRRYATAQEMQLDLEKLALEQKLPLSTVSLQSLMAGLFDRRVEAWHKLQQGAKDVGELILLESATPSDEPNTQVTDFDRVRPGSAPRPRAKLRRRALVGAITAALLALLALAGGRYAEAERQAAATAALRDEAERLADAIGSQARELHMRASAVATMPMLRAAVETDAATVADLAGHDFVFSPMPGEVLELYQSRDGKLVSLLRIPKQAAALGVAQRRAAELRAVGDHAALKITVDVAPLYTAKAAGGTIALLRPIDLAVTRERLGRRFDHVVLQLSSTQTVQLVLGTGETTAHWALPLAREWQLDLVDLAAAPPPAAFGWASDLGGALLVISAVLLFVFAWARRAPARRASTSLAA